MLPKYSRILNAVYSAIWAIQPEKLDQIVSFLEFAAAGGRYTPDEVAERIGVQAAETTQQQAAQAKASNIAVIPIRGVIAQRMSMFSDISGGASTEKISRELRAALADETVKAVIFDIDSPGGSVYGVDELWQEIFEARGKKPMVAQLNPKAASAAYYLATAADEIAMMPTGEAGSVGVVMRHVDESKALELEGIKVTYIHAGDFKTEANPFEPLSEEAKKYLQKRVDDYYGMFVKAVSKGRNIPAAAVRNDFGKGRMLGADDAVAVGMVDRIATFDETVRRLAGRKGATLVSPGARAEAAEIPVDASASGTAVVEAAETPTGRSVEEIRAARNAARRRLAAS